MGMTENRRREAWWLPAGLFLVALLFLLAFHRYNLWDMTEGWVIADEGHQVYQPTRWMAGQWYYRDFSTDNYPPGYLFLHAALFELFGVKMSVIRVFLSFVGAGIAAMAYIIARWIMPAGWAIAAYALSLTWNVLNLNIGYPSWYCALLGLIALWAILQYTEGEGRTWLVLAGVLTGLSLALKTTQGVYQWIGIALFLAWRSSAAGDSQRNWKRRLISWEAGLAGLALLLAAFLLRTYATFVNLLVFGAPVLFVSVAATLGWPAREKAGETAQSFLLELVWMGVGMVVVTAAWAIPTVVQVGGSLFIEGTFLAPLRHSAFMHAPIRPPTINGWLLMVWAVAGGWWMWRSRRVRAGALIAYGLAASVLLFVPFGAGVAPREMLRIAFQTWRNLRFYLFLTGSVAIWWLLWARQVRTTRQSALVLLLMYGSWNFMQVYPFADSNHLLWSIQPAFIVLAYLAYRLWEAGKTGLAHSTTQWLPITVAFGALPALLIALQIYPLIGHFYRLEDGLKRVPYAPLDQERADVFVQEDAAETLRAVASAVKTRTREEDTLFDTSGSFFYFVTGRHNATRHDFMWPGFLMDGERAQLIRDLDSRRPALVIRRETSEHVVGYASFADAFPTIAAYIETHYQLETEIGEYSLWSLK